MNFDNVAFFVFLAAVLALYHALPWKAGRWLLPVASYVFYGTANPWYCILLFTSTMIDFHVARRIHVAADRGARKRLLLISIVMNIGLLGVFKYGNFGIANMNAMLAYMGLPEMALLNLVLPVGISFYTFQTLSYTIDVYREKTRPTSDFLAFALYVSYFPQLVAGPIERAGHLLPQLMKKQPVGLVDFELGVQRILWGLVKKVVFADRLALMVGDVYAAPGQAGSPVLIAATMGFMIQLYLDFSAYTDIAIGIARLMGVRLSENFNWPLVGRNPSDFWARWHMTLTRWFGDYVHASLGGTTRKRPYRNFFNVMITITLMGLWHGASWNFLVFGVLLGLVVGGYHSLRLFLPRKGRGPLLGSRWWSNPLAVLLNMTCLHTILVFFRASSLPVSMEILGGIFTHPWAWQQQYNLHLALITMVWGIHIFRALFMSHRREVPMRALPRALFMAVMLLLILYGAVDSREQFIYFQF